MNYVRYRKHPGTYKKNLSEKVERVLDLSVPAAVGILAFTFVKGMFWGYMLKKRFE